MLKNLFNLQFFATPNTNVTTDAALSDEMKTFYDKNLIRLVGPALVHDQFAQKKPIPKNRGKIIEFRRYVSLAKALTALTEGVTPNGKKLTVTALTATAVQYGDYVTISDVLQLTAIDNNLVEAQELLADQAGRTLDTISRDIMNAGTNVMYAGSKTARASLAASSKLTVADVRKAVRILKLQNTKKIDGYYIALIHPTVAYDIMGDSDWVNASQYAGSTQIFEGEIGKLHGVRFIESTECKIWNDETCPVKVADPLEYYSVYSTLFFGANWYGTTDIEGGGLQFIVKQLGSGGTDDPLEQRATAGWKAMKVTEILVQSYGLRVESLASFNDDAN